jgi:hypothetical protein
MVLLAGITGCSESFLDRPPEDRITRDNYYQSEEQLRSGTAALYNIVWFDFNGRSGYLLGDIRSNNLLSPWGFYAYYMFTVTSLDVNLAEAWRSFHNVIAQSNATMINIRERSSNVTEAEINAAVAECRFMRATAYFHLVRLWGPVILIEDNVELVENAIRPLNPAEDVYEFVIRDLKFAAENLPEEDTPGRVTSWSAKGMLAKVYLARSGYGSDNGMRDQAMLDSAAFYAADVCHNSGLELVPDYKDLFTYAYNVNRNAANTESLFSLLWVPLGTWGYQNATFSDFAFSTEVTGGVNCWSSTTCSYDLLTTYDDWDTLRRNATFFTEGTYYPEINVNDGGYTYQEQNANIKKYMPGGPDDNEGMVAVMNSPLNTYMLRLADVYLVYAEASLGNQDVLSDGEALVYFNKVRERAGVTVKNSIDFEDIMYERRIELAMEYQYWYDLVAWYYFKPDFILNYINNQQRAVQYTAVKNSDRRLTVTITSEPPNAPVATAGDMYFPYPESEVLQNPYFNEEPVPYDFGIE